MKEDIDTYDLVMSIDEEEIEDNNDLKVSDDTIDVSEIIREINNGDKQYE